MAHKPKTGPCWHCLLGQTGAESDIAGEAWHRFVREISARPGDPFKANSHGNAVLVINEGVLKSERALPDGRVAVTGFHYPGDVVEMPAAVARETAFEAVTACRACEVDLSQARDSCGNTRRCSTASPNTPWREFAPTKAGS